MPTTNPLHDMFPAHEFGDAQRNRIGESVRYDMIAIAMRLRDSLPDNECRAITMELLKTVYLAANAAIQESAE